MARTNVETATDKNKQSITTELVISAVFGLVARLPAFVRRSGIHAVQLSTFG